MHKNSKKAISDVNWLVWETGPSDLKHIPKETFDELLGIKKRLNYLLDDETIKIVISNNETIN